ncbi:MAG: hypothetical protein CBE08_000585 [Euryarchaeota archaeon TMED248]|nr:MAG: hypothetical protein CBE08_000585 [Euryarchaeota archaeon TMED248]
MPRELSKKEPNSGEEITNFRDNVLKKQKDETMSLVDCPYCKRRLRVPETFSGRITCSNCNKVFDRKNEQIHLNLYDDKGRLKLVTNAQRHAGVTPGKQIADAAIGFGLSIILTIIMFCLIMIYTFSQW